MSEAGFTPEERNAFRRDGYFIARELAPAPMCARLLDVTRYHLSERIEPIEYEADLHYPGAPQSRDAAGGETARRLLQACARDPIYREWATCDAVGTRLHELIGPRVTLVQAHHNCVMTKHPRFGSVTGWHQDIRYWSFERAELVSVWLALGPERPENGGLSFIPGTHEMEFARERLDDMLFLRPELPQNQALIEQRMTPLLEPGDVVFFHCRTFHAAGNNRLDEIKLSPVFTYHAADNRPLPGTRSASLAGIVL
jgi:phytanoyl-CoA hydroxylase